MSSQLKVIIVAATLAISAQFIAYGSVSGSSAVVKNTPSNVSATPTPDELAVSRDLYKTNCAKCHQDSGKGGKSVVDGRNIDAQDLTTDRMRKRDDDKFFDDISEGSPDDGMPAFKGKLTNAQINEVIKYIRVGLQSAPTK